MQKLNPLKTGYAFGLTFAAVHVLWSVVVALGFGQRMVNMIQWEHMVRTAVIVVPFDLVTALLLIVITGATGCVVGFIFGHIWNFVHQ